MITAFPKKNTPFSLTKMDEIARLKEVREECKNQLKALSKHVCPSKGNILI